MSDAWNIVWNTASLTDAFRAIGLNPGDLVLVHSALRRLGPVVGGADTVIDALLAAVGPTGTVAVPTHTWKVVTREQPVFHQTFTPSHVGALGNVLRQRAEAIRSLHPTHSVAAIGPRAAALNQRARTGRHALLTHEPVWSTARLGWKNPDHRRRSGVLHVFPRLRGMGRHAVGQYS